LRLAATLHDITKVKHLVHFSSAILSLLMLVGCAGVVTEGSVSKLRPGMTVDETTKIMGSASSTQFAGDVLVRKYTTWRPFVGYVPLYLAYNAKTGRLISWQENMAEYYANNSMMMSAINPLIPQQVNVNQNIRAAVDHSGSVNHVVW
jgi:hypothetical protein